MTRKVLLPAGVVLAALLLWPQVAQEEDPARRPFPGSKDLREEVLKQEHERSIKDAERLIELSKELKADLEKNTRHVVSLTTIRKTEEIERLARRIRSRMSR
jgi:hypothetical protein